jgi:hypothetical protein
MPCGVERLRLLSCRPDCTRVVQTRAHQLKITGERIPRLRHANVAPRCCLASRVPAVQLVRGDAVIAIGRPRHGQKVDQHGLASLLRPNNNSTHHGVDAAAPHTFSRLQAQHREEASETIDGDDAHDSTVVKDRNFS